MYLKYTVQPTEALPFNPTELVIIVGERYMQNGVEVVEMYTELTERKINGKTTECETNLVPSTALNAITGFDVNTLQPVIDVAGLNQILLAFKLQVV